MKTPWIATLAGVLLCFTGATRGQSESASLPRTENGVPISRLIATVAKKTGKKFVVEPRVQGDANIVGQDAANISYDDLLTILHVYGDTAVEYGGYVTVVPDAAVRQQPLHQVSGKETRPDAEFVSKIITVKNVPAAHLVPLLRPMLPPVAHLVALPCVNKLLIVDTFAMVQRIQAIIEALDTGEPYTPEKCSAHESWMTPGATNLPPASRETTVEHR